MNKQFVSAEYDKNDVKAIIGYIVRLNVNIQALT